MVIVETPAFTKAIVELLDDASYADLQRYLVARPEAGDLVRGGGGIRKVRWAIHGQGKRGGLRIIYFWNHRTETLCMLWPYGKAVCEDLTPKMMQRLSRFVKENLK